MKKLTFLSDLIVLKVLWNRIIYPLFFISILFSNLCNARADIYAFSPYSKTQSTESNHTENTLINVFKPSFRLIQNVLSTIALRENANLNDQTIFSNRGNNDVTTPEDQLTITSVKQVSSCTESLITITGTNFSGVTKVNFGGTPPKSFVVLSPTLINAILNKGVTGDVTVTAQAETAVYKGFIYVAPVAPSIHISASSTAICAGTPVAFTAAVNNGGSKPTYQWKLNRQAIGVDSNTYSSSTLSNNDTITCEIIGDASCYSITTVTSNFIKMIVKPTAEVKVLGDSCLGDTLTVSSDVTPSSLAWVVNGTSVVASAELGLSRNAVTVAGGNGAGDAPNQLNNPDRFFVDKEGNIYVADMSNNRIQKWAPGATYGVTVAGGNGPGSGAKQFNKPTDVAMDSKGNLYITDQGNNRIQKWAPGTTTGTTFIRMSYSPTSIFIDAYDFVYVAEQQIDHIMVYPPNSRSNEIGSNAAGYRGSVANPLTLNGPTGIFPDASGFIYICDTNNDRIQKWAPYGRYGVTVAGGNGHGSAPNQLANPLGVFVDKNRSVYIADYNNARVQKWGLNATKGVTIAGGNGAGNGADQLDGPQDVWVTANGDLLVSDFHNHRIQKSSNSITTTYTTQAAGVYTAKVALSNGCSVTSNPVSVVAAKTPVVSIRTDTTTVCAGAKVTFTAVAENGGDNPLYQWKINNVNIGANSSKSFFSSSSLKTGDVVICEMTSNATSCVTAETAMSNKIVMDVKSPETTSIIISASDTVICPGARVNFTATATNAREKVLYEWRVNDVIRGTGSQSGFLVSDLKNGDVVSAKITSSGFCATQLTAISNVIPIQVITPPVLSVTLVASDSAICAGVNVNYTATAINAGEKVLYECKVNNFSRATGTQPSFSVNDLKDGDVVSAKITGSDFCGTELTAVSNVIPIRVITPPVLSVTLKASDSAICAGATVNFTAVTINAGTNPTYNWKVNNTIIQTSSTVYVNSSINDGDVVNVIITPTQKCAMSPVVSNTLKMVVDQIPTVKPRADTTILTGSSVRLRTTVTGNITTYLWTPSATIDNNIIASPLATPTKTTKYKVVVTTPAGCTAEGNVLITTIDEVTIPNAFSPNNDGINDIWNITGLYSYADCSIDVFNRNGQPVFHSYNYKDPWNGTFNGSPLPVGTYYYIIKSKKFGTKSGPVTLLR
ncbi:gliding motility-associated C-terminal domain-containing protein [Segetibacter koreensis]|uniref:T9SS type B sorting domain-containing protein n=1 Tax=Segetibacter koreensis TaxID=398037 RepID=UPI00036E69E1|nr:gliding motility-associated C-terminal domain-containing protein [Segetibacter koreensis]